jgi:pilus assembly protein Flp/PilA
MLMKKLTTILNNNAGANLVEYIILVGVVALLAIGAFTAFGEDVQGKIKEEGEKVSGIATE